MWRILSEPASTGPGGFRFGMSLVSVVLSLAVFAVAAVRSSQDGEFEETEVEIPNGSIHLSGTLTLPSGGGPHPCIVLLTGHGMEARDAEALGFRFLESMAQRLARRGLAVLRCDKRGTGKSTGNFREATLEDFAEDALATVRFLKLRKKIDGKRVGLCGHSEGGWTAALAASRSEDLDFLILLATFGIPVEGADRIQLEAMAKARGSTAEEIERIRLLQERVYAAARAGEVTGDLESEIHEQVKVQFDKVPENQRPPICAFVQKEIDRILSPNFRYLLEYSPPEVLKQIRCPTLAVFGESDSAVPAEVNQIAMREAFRAGGKASLTLRVIPEANHVFMTADIGTPEEIPYLKKEFAPGFLDAVAEWVLDKH